MTIRSAGGSQAATSPPARRCRIYLAGPEVFLPQAASVGAEKCRLAATAGFEGVFPHDAEERHEPVPPLQRARRIFTANVDLIRSCDALIANLTPFRGVSADPGTVFELGYMYALGRPVAAYTNTPQDYRTRAAAFRRARPASAHDSDRPDCGVEDYGLADNLMIDMAVAASGGILVRQGTGTPAAMADLTGFRQCLDHLAGLLAR